MIELIEPESQYDGITLRDLLKLVEASGGSLDTPLYISADGEPVYINAYLEGPKS